MMPLDWFFQEQNLWLERFQYYQLLTGFYMFMFQKMWPTSIDGWWAKRKNSDVYYFPNYSTQANKYLIWMYNHILSTFNKSTYL